MKRQLALVALILFVFAACTQASTQTGKPAGDQEEQRYAELDSLMNARYNEYKVLYQQESIMQTEEGRKKMAELEQLLNQYEEEQVNLVVSIAEKNHDNSTPAKYIADAMYSLSYPQLEKVLDPTAAYYNDPQLDKPKKHLEMLKLRAPGTPFKELAMQNPDGKTVKLSDWVGKGNYVLVDFWASWCGPCRMEMPNVVANYHQYKDKGFDVVGVSFDNNADAWKKAIKSLQMPWHHISDLKGWQCAAASLYGINSIPSNVLLDKEGKIIAIDLRGEALGNKLKEIFEE